jgi:putative addiction module component (TIGR02574 family)
VALFAEGRLRMEGRRVRILELSDEQAAEIDRCLEAHRADPDDYVSWEELRERLMERAKSPQSGTQTQSAPDRGEGD